MRKLLIIFLICNNYCYTQYYNSLAIDSINTNKLGGEGDLYIDTINKKYYLGITTGELLKIGDTSDELIDSVAYLNDSIFIYQNDSAFKLFTPNIYNENGTLTSRRILDGSNYSMLWNDIDSLSITADTIYFNRIPTKHDTTLNFLNVNPHNNHINKVDMSIEYFYILSGPNITLSHLPITGETMIKLYYNGQLLYKDKDYIISGATISLLFNSISQKDSLMIEYYHN